MGRQARGGVQELLMCRRRSAPAVLPPPLSMGGAHLQMPAAARLGSHSLAIAALCSLVFAARRNASLSHPNAIAAGRMASGWMERRLSHQPVVPTPLPAGACVHEGDLYLVTELMQGGDLWTALHSGRITWYNRWAGSSQLACRPL